MLTIRDLEEICEIIELAYGSDGNIVIQIRDEKESLVNGTYVESMNRDSSGTLYLRGYSNRLNTPFTDLYYYHLKSRFGEDILKPRIGFDRRGECPYYDEDLGCSECAAEHCDYY